MKLFQSIIEAQQTHKTCVLCTIVRTHGSTPQKAGAKMLVFEDGSIEGTIGGGIIEHEVIFLAKQLIQNQLTTDFVQIPSNNTSDFVEVFLELIKPLVNLYIFGAGHVGKSLSFFAKPFDFAITLIDPRPNHTDNNNIRYIQKDYIEALSMLVFNKHTFVVIATPSHDTDKELLIKTATLPHAYIGLIGSKKKIENIRNYCLKHNLLSKEQLSAINMPIGIDIASISPNEIAISILAKIIDVKNKIGF